ncbi:MAG: hypothetical protein RL150_183 [Candidatus Parcubacteria bacterium]|jgi:hypothetical protein
MRTRRIIYTILVLITLVVAFFIIGALAPEYYEGEREVLLTDRSVDIWKNLTSPETITARKPDVEYVELISESYEAVSWREHLKNGQMRTLRVLEREAPTHVKIERFQSDDGVTGTWTYTLEEIDNYTLVTVHEESLNKNIVKRAWYTIIGRSILLRREEKALRVSLFDRLLKTP